MRIRCFAAKASARGTATVFAEVPKDTPTPTAENKGWVWQHTVKDTPSAIQTLQTFSATMTRNKADMVLPRLLVLKHVGTVEDSLRYLREVLPVGAQVLESHPSIGGSYGRTNAHGNPLDPHVAGICHLFPNHSISELAALLDVYLPTRLVLSQSNISYGGGEDPMAMETVIENTDAIQIFNTLKQDSFLQQIWRQIWKAQDLKQEQYHQEIWRQIWKAQRRDNCLETSVLVDNPTDAEKMQKLFQQWNE